MRGGFLCASILINVSSINYRPDIIRSRTQSCDSTTTAMHIFAPERNGPCYSGKNCTTVNRFKLDSDRICSCSAGICLPKNILDLFHTGDSTTTGISYVTQISYLDDDVNINTDSNKPHSPPSAAANVRQYQSSINQQQQQHHHHQPPLLSAQVQLSQSFNVVNAFGDDESAEPNTNNNSSLSSLSDISSATSAASRRSKWMSKHNRHQCFHCCGRLDANVTIASVPKQRRYSTPLSPTPPPARSSSADLTSGSSEFSDAADRISDAILRHVQRMANPVWSKQSKMALLELKQKHGSAYQDVCLYTEVCRALSANTYRLPARRFLQELFLDLRFDGFASRAADAFARCEPDVLRRVAALDLVDEQEQAAKRTVTASHEAVKMDSYDDPEPNPIGQQQQNSEHIYAAVKTLRHSQLPSVTEASVENLAESLGNKSRLVPTR